MKIDAFHGEVLRMEKRYAVLRLDDGIEKPVLLSALPEEVKIGDRLCKKDARWISETEAMKKEKGRIRTLRKLLRGE